MSLRERIQKEFDTAINMQDSALRCNNSAEIQGMLRVGMLPNIMRIIDEMKAEIFPLPLGDLPINPKTGQRDIIVLDLKDWLPFINNLRKWFLEQGKT